MGGGSLYPVLFLAIHSPLPFVSLGVTTPLKSASWNLQVGLEDLVSSWICEGNFYLASFVKNFFLLGVGGGGWGGLGRWEEGNKFRFAFIQNAKKYFFFLLTRTQSIMTKLFLYLYSIIICIILICFREVFFFNKKNLKTLAFY